MTNLKIDELDILKKLIELYAKQENIKITYRILKKEKGFENENN